MKTKKRLLPVIIGVLMAINISVFSPMTMMHTYAADSLVYGDFTYVIEDNNEITITGYTGTETTVIVPGTIEGKTVTQIGNCAFEEKDIVNVTLPDSITKINYKAFSKCKNLETINFPESLKSIGSYAFTTCHSLKAVEFGSQIESIEECAFQLCVSLTEITVPGSVKTVVDHAFQGCQSAKELVFEEGVTTIEGTAALNMYSIKKIVIPRSVTTIGDYALGYAYYHPNYTRIDLTIYGYSNTAAETYATVNGFNFVDLDRVAVTGVSLDKASATLKTGETLTLTATVTPDNADNKNVVWSSDDESIATVTNGVVTAVATGSAKITATTVDGNKTASCTVIVTCNHAFGTEYKKDANNHWTECACGEKTGVEAHNPGPEATEESAQTCTVCGYEIAPKLNHTHAFGTEYKKDANNHWTECACGEKNGVEAHVPGPAATEENAQTCTVCGYEIAPKLTHTHAFGTEYEKDASNHWTECACGEKNGVEAHNPGPEATEESAQTCTVCGYEIAPAITPAPGGEHTHSFNGYKYNDSEHWGECSCGVRSQMLPHEFEWIVDKAATQQEAGSKHEECTYCHYSRPAVEIANTAITSPKTGDNTYQWIFLLAGISGMVGMGTLACRKSKKIMK